MNKRLNISALWFVEILECLVGAWKKAKNGHFWGKNYAPRPQFRPKMAIFGQKTSPNLPKSRSPFGVHHTINCGLRSKAMRCIDCGL
jgi:hypothetical protein